MRPSEHPPPLSRDIPGRRRAANGAREHGGPGPDALTGTHSQPVVKWHSSINDSALMPANNVQAFTAQLSTHKTKCTIYARQRVNLIIHVVSVFTGRSGSRRSVPICLVSLGQRVGRIDAWSGVSHVADIRQIARGSFAPMPREMYDHSPARSIPGAGPFRYYPADLNCHHFCRVIKCQESAGECNIGIDSRLFEVNRGKPMGSDIEDIIDVIRELYLLSTMHVSLTHTHLY